MAQKSRQLLLLRVAAFIVVMMSLGLPIVCAAETPGDAFIRADGKRLVTPDGRTFFVKGINLGLWLVPEGYMFRFDRKTEAPDQIRRVFERLLGHKGAA